MAEIINIGGGNNRGVQDIDPKLRQKIASGASLNPVEQAIADQLRQTECGELVKYDLEKYNCKVDPILMISQSKGLWFGGFNILATPIDGEDPVAAQVRAKECSEHVRYNLQKFVCMIDPQIMISSAMGIQTMGFDVIAVRVVKLPGR